MRWRLVIGLLTCTAVVTCLRMPGIQGKEIDIDRNVGYLQVNCEEGIRVLVNGKDVGRASAQLGGLVVQDLRPGEYRLTLVKEGFESAEAKVKVVAGEVTLFRAPKLAKKAGVLVVRSLPVECEITCGDIGLRNVHKDVPIWRHADLAIGFYEVSFAALGKRLQKRIEIRRNLEARVMVNFLEEEIDVEYPDVAQTMQKLREAMLENDLDGFMSFLTEGDRVIARDYAEFIRSTCKLMLTKVKDMERRYPKYFREAITPSLLRTNFDAGVAQLFWNKISEGLGLHEGGADELLALLLNGEPRQVSNEKTVLKTLVFTPEDGVWKLRLTPENGDTSEWLKSHKAYLLYEIQSAFDEVENDAREWPGLND
ncbi:MAG: PEGA domain-containing protein [Planctomycetes bacterium]|nr:PEGA domain-containing protein [Planctomycetota bacterium]